HVDVAVRHVDEFNSSDSPVEFKAYGRGGTSLGCVFRYIEENDIECEGLIFFTDLANTDWGNEPDYPVLWLHSNPYKY
ncbi:hypothetical protein GM547_14565, partial [Streptococcus pneumoniae]|uniref:VWA-like domain-containing protein n=1 Tax=Streptococcus pneumoniae TaxID=1313 RepID=UPI00139FE8AB